MKLHGTTAIAAAGSGLASPLFLVFLVLKLTNTIGWSWWLVTAPLWAPGALILALIVLAALVIGGVGLAMEMSKK